MKLRVMLAMTTTPMMTRTTTRILAPMTKNLTETTMIMMIALQEWRHTTRILQILPVKLAMKINRTKKMALQKTGR